MLEVALRLAVNIHRVLLHLEGNHGGAGILAWQGVTVRMNHQTAVVLATLKLVNYRLQRLVDTYRAVNSHDDRCVGIAEGMEAHGVALGKW